MSAIILGGLQVATNEFINYCYSNNPDGSGPGGAQRPPHRPPPPRPAQESLLQATSSLSDADDLMPTSSPASEPSHLPEPPPSQPPSTNNDIPTDPPSLQHPPSSTSVEPPPHVPESPRPNRKPFCILALLIASIAIIYFGNNYISSRGVVIPKSDEL
jgi:hypothetical protein